MRLPRITLGNVQGNVRGNVSNRGNAQAKECATKRRGRAPILTLAAPILARGRGLGEGEEEGGGGKDRPEPQSNTTHI